MKILSGTGRFNANKSTQFEFYIKILPRTADFIMQKNDDFVNIFKNIIENKSKILKTLSKTVASF